MIRIWDAATGEVVAGPFTCYTGAVTFVAFSLDEKATELTASVYPVKGSTTTSPVMASHTRTVRSFEADAMRCSSGENATEKALSVCPVNGLAAIFPVAVSHANRAISRGRRDPLPFRRESNKNDPIGVTSKRT
jgi:hypothetical protein